jgi:betaine-aldehyde dehydrogenase
VSDQRITDGIARHWIDGAWVGSDRVSTSTNPSTGGAHGQFADGGAEEAKASIAAARRAFDFGTWASDRNARAAAIYELTRRVEERADRIALSLAREMGKAITHARLEAPLAMQTLRYNAGATLSQTGVAAEQAPGVLVATRPSPKARSFVLRCSNPKGSTFLSSRMRFSGPC